MAERPVFIPLLSGPRLVDRVMVNFRWHAGMAASQKKKNVIELHDAAHARGMEHLLEISSKSEREIGRKLSAFHQKVILNKKEIILECAFQGSKVFRDGGPFPDLFDLDPREAKRDSRLKESGPLQSFKFDGQDFPLDPPTVFYDWLYINAILPARSWLQRLGKMDGFTDLEFNPERSINCQAYSCALFISLEKRGVLDQAVSSLSNFLAASKGGVI